MLTYTKSKPPDLSALSAKCNTNTLVLLDAGVILHRVDFLCRKYNDFSSDWIGGMVEFMSTAAFLLLPHRQFKVLWLMDTPNPQYWRSDHAPAYKQNRSPKDPTLLQIAEIFNAAVKQNHYLSVPGFEADDLAGAIARIVEPRKFEVFLCTSDSDWLGLISDQITWIGCQYQPLVRRKLEAWLWVGRKRLKQSKKLQALWSLPTLENFKPSDIWEWKAATGDPSDNLPPGCDIGLISLLHPKVDVLDSVFLAAFQAEINKAETYQSDRSITMEYLSELLDVPWAMIGSNQFGEAQ